MVGRQRMLGNYRSPAMHDTCLRLLKDATVKSLVAKVYNTGSSETRRSVGHCWLVPQRSSSMSGSKSTLNAKYVISYLRTSSSLYV